MDLVLAAAAGFLAVTVSLAAHVYATLRGVRLEGGRLVVRDAGWLAWAAMASLTAGTGSAMSVGALAPLLGLDFDALTAMEIGLCASAATTAVYVAALALAGVIAAAREAIEPTPRDGEDA